MIARVDHGETRHTLSDYHRRLLREESGLSDEAIDARGYVTIHDKTDLARIGFKGAFPGPGYGWPTFDHTGARTRAQVRLDIPTDHGKYRYSTGKGVTVDVPPLVHERVMDRSIPLWITEGTKKADAGASRGLAIVSVGGVSSWKCDCWGFIPVKDRDVVICLDNDIFVKGKLYRQAKSFGDFLTRKGARVQYASMGAFEGEKVGLDDYLVAGGKLEEIHLLPDLPRPPKGSVIEGALDQPQIRNVRPEMGNDGKIHYMPISLQRIADQIRETTNDRFHVHRVSGGASRLFYDDGSSVFDESVDPLVTISTQAEFRGRLHLHGPIFFRSKPTEEVSLAQPEDIFASAPSLFDVHAGLSYFPHHPPMPNTYYPRSLDDALPEPTGEALATLTASFNPGEEIDRDLMVAALLTLFAGIPCGQRPLFAILAKAGVSSGKTTFVDSICRAAGGVHMFTKEDLKDPRELGTKLMSPQSYRKRALLFDNYKGVLHSQFLESYLTARVIVAKELYKGQGGRLNDLTNFVTMNGGDLGTDMASRSVPIFIGPPKRNASQNYEEWLDAFYAAHHRQLVADCLAVLRSEPKCEITRDGSRFSAWDRAVLTRFENGQELATELETRRGDVDVTQQSSTALVEAIRAVLDIMDRPGTLNRPFPDTWRDDAGDACLERSRLTFEEDDLAALYAAATGDTETRYARARLADIARQIPELERKSHEGLPRWIYSGEKFVGQRGRRVTFAKVFEREHGKWKIVEKLSELSAE